jgi:hypothetical protein
VHIEASDGDRPGGALHCLTSTRQLMQTLALHDEKGAESVKAILIKSREQRRAGNCDVWRRRWGWRCGGRNNNALHVHLSVREMAT